MTAGAGTPLTLTGGQRRLLYCDGADVVAVVPDFASTGGGGDGGGFPVFRGALIKRTVDVTIPTSSPTILDWESTVCARPPVNHKPRRVAPREVLDDRELIRRLQNRLAELESGKSARIRLGS